MTAVTQQRPRMSLELFRSFVEDRPDEEHWELIDGVAMMMAPPTFGHQIISRNLQRLLDDSLERHDPELIALARIGLNLGPTVEDYDPEPDVVVIDRELAEKIGERYAGRFYLVAEIVSSSDRPIIENKRAVYKLHESCKCVLTIQQERFDVRVDLRGAGGWEESKLADKADRLILADFGLDCSVADLYLGTSLLPRRARRTAS